MNFSDQWATDTNGTKFVFRVEDQRKLSEMGLPVSPDSLAEIVPNQSAHPKVQEEKAPAQKTTSLETESVPNDLVLDDEEFDEPETIQIDPETGKYRGRIKWYNFAKGYGFIARGGGEDIFFHKTDVVGDPQNLLRGAWVHYDVEETEKGFEASDVEYHHAQE